MLHRVGLFTLVVAGCAAPAVEEPAAGETSGGVEGDDAPDPDPSAGSTTTPAETTSPIDDDDDEEATGTDDGAESSGSGPVDPTDGCAIGTTPASAVITLGDSYLAITSVIFEIMERARANGSLGQQEYYRRYEAAGAGLWGIAGQFQEALGEDPVIDTVIMDGGGNDVLLGGANICLDQPPPDPTCVAAIDSVVATGAELLQDMADAGVKHVVYHFYPHLPVGLAPAGTNDVLDYGAPLFEQMCQGAPVDCHFVDIRDAFEGHPEYILDGVHPTDEGSAVIAELVWETMVEHCIAQ